MTMLSILKTPPMRPGALAAACAALALAAGLAAASASPALAADPNPASTTMSLKIDATQIVASVPTDVAIAVKGDGTFVAPDDVALENQSVFAVHVAKVKATVTDSPKFTLVAKGDSFTNATTDDTLWMTVTAGTHELDLSTATGTDGVETQAGQWNMGQASTADDTDKLSLALAGKVKNAKSIKTDTAATALTVQWTLAAGDATATPATP